MGNTKTYYIEGELAPGVTLEVVKKSIVDGFHSTYCVAEIVQEDGGYLGVKPGDGPYLLAAVHSYSLSGDHGPRELCQLFKEFRMHRVDSDWADCWIAWWADGKFEEWRAHSDDWQAVKKTKV